MGSCQKAMSSFFTWICCGTKQTEYIPIDELICDGLWRIPLGDLKYVVPPEVNCEKLKPCQCDCENHSDEVDACCTCFWCALPFTVAKCVAVCSMSRNHILEFALPARYCKDGTRRRLNGLAGRKVTLTISEKYKSWRKVPSQFHVKLETLYKSKKIDGGDQSGCAGQCCDAFCGLCAPAADVLEIVAKVCFICIAGAA